ncbi:MAG: phenylalanine--tRNA ligase beta subunit-related protein [Candidatus Dojkabacteria bacterium]|nr:phenylalanine--tRNA ligase beta subunit-related protein [Candidatus Dojkabacteria bacterium]
MKFTVTQKIFDKFPNAKFGALLIEGIDNSKKHPEIVKLLEKQIAETMDQFSSGAVKSLPQIKSWRRVFKELGLNREFLPSHEALLTRVISKGELPDINPLVNIYNIISLKYLIPIGGHDTDKAPVIRIDETTGEESFQVMNSEEVLEVEKGELAYISGNKILTRNFVWRQSDTSKTDVQTQNVFIPIDNAAGDMSEKEIKEIAEELKTLITSHLGGKAAFGMINQKNPSVSLSGLDSSCPNEDLVIGEITKVENHPNSDHLLIATVKLGKDKPIRIVCGALNTKQGSRVVIALPGTKLIDPKDPDHKFEVKKVEIRGELSEGVICSERELGIGNDHSGVLILDKNAPIGERFQRQIEPSRNLVNQIPVKNRVLPR